MQTQDVYIYIHTEQTSFVAYFQNGSLFNLGDDFKDSCGTDKDTCMSLLSLQLLVLMIVKPLPKFFYDMVWP